jgi:NAD(P)-dependent dehydrogenase (short-subunit alcohol dehydrogenase family)
MMMQNKVALVTGANGDMGKVIATELARQGACVVGVVRRREQGEALQHDIIQATGNSEVHFLVADLADQRQIRRLVDEFHQHFSYLHVVVNNAGVHLRERRLSPDGIEMHFAVNHLAWFLLTNLLLDTLKASVPARVVNVASQSMADARQIPLFGKPRPVALQLDDLQSERHFEPMDAYARSKLVMVMCGYALARRLKDTQVTVNALHPGLVSTGIASDAAPPIVRPFLGLVRPFLLSPQAGAQSAIYLATSPEVEGVTGQYFVRGKPGRSVPISYDEALQERVWNISAELVGLEHSVSHRS